MEVDKGIFNYFGSKATIAEWIIQSFPPSYERYVEVFGGSGRVLLDKPNNCIEIYNDFNSHLPNLFEVIRTKRDEFVEELRKLIISEVIYNHFFEELEKLNKPVEFEGDKMIVNVERAVMYFYIMSFAHKAKFTGGFSLIPDKGYTEKIQEKINTINWLHQRLKNVIITNKSYEKIISANNKEGVLIYLDPPYINTESYYSKLAGSFTQADHIKLRDLLKKHKGYFVLSYEADVFVNDLYSDFFIIGKEKYRPGKGEEVEEILVTNYKPQNTLFDNESMRNTLDRYKTQIQPGLF